MPRTLPSSSVSLMWMRPKTANIRARALMAAMLGLAALAGVGTASASPARAKAAHTLDVTDEAHLHLVATAGEILEEEGPAKGALPGTVRVRVTVSESITGTFTFSTRYGSITGHGSAQLHPTGRYSSFSGTLAVSHGTGRYTHAHGSGGLYGVVDRRTHAMTVQTTGKLSY
jgi:hypothetical protein